MRVSIIVFGLTEFGIRAPAFVGALTYAAAGFAVCRRFVRRRSTRALCMFCLLLNPFVLDYLVAARGYSLALGFWMLTLGYCLSAFRIARCRFQEGAKLRMMAGASAAGALALWANFAFGLALVSTLAVTAGGMLRFVIRRREWVRLPSYLAAIVLPGFGISAFSFLPSILQWPRGHLEFGASSVGEMITSLARNSVFEVNPYIIHPIWMGLATRLGKHLPFALVLSVTVLLVARRRVPRRFGQRRPMAAVGFLATSIALSLFAHVAAWKFFGLPLPMDRTALFFVPLITLLIFLVLDLPALSRSQRFLRSAAQTLAIALCVQFFLCLRLTYFQEWKYDAETRQAYLAVQELHGAGARILAADWKYVSCLSFYRRALGPKSMPDFRSRSEVGHADVYVLHARADANLIDELGLSIYFRGSISDVVVAVPSRRR